MFKVLNAYAGYANVNYVLNEVKNPVRTLLISGPLGLALCAIFYLFINTLKYIGQNARNARTDGRENR